MKKNNWKKIAILSGILLVLLVSLWLPGRLFAWQDKKILDKVETEQVQEVILHEEETTTMLEKVKLFSGFYSMNGGIQVAHLDRVVLSDIEELTMSRAVRKAYDTLCELEVIRPLNLSEKFWNEVEQDKFGFLVFDMNRPGYSIVVWAYILYDEEETIVLNIEQESKMALGVAQWRQDWEQHPENVFCPDEEAVKSYMEYLDLKVKEIIPITATSKLSEEAALQLGEELQENRIYSENIYTNFPTQEQAYSISIRDGQSQIFYMFKQNAMGFRLGERTLWD